MRPEERRRRWFFWIAPPLLLLVTLFSWAWSSPVGSSPDDDFHLASIWCGQGERPALCAGTDSEASREVPGTITSARCYTFLPAQSAACWNPDLTRLTETKRADTEGTYPPVYYSVLSVLASDDVALSVAAMRLANALFATALLTTVFWVLPRSARTAYVVSLAVTLVPLGLFIIPSTNPSSWALLASATVWVTLWAAYGVSGRRQWALAALAIFSTFVGAGARADAGAFAVFAVVLAAILGLRRIRHSIVPVISSAIVILISAAFYLSASQSAAVLEGLSNDDPPLTLAQHAQNVLDLPALWVEAIGGARLGWLDTDMPPIVSVATTIALGVAIVLSLRGMAGGRLWASVAAFAAIWVVPFVLLARSNAVVGSQVQPRYILPLIIILVGVSSASVSAPHWWRGARAYVTAIALALAATVALHINVRRYTVGTDSPALDPGARAEWWWAGVPAPSVVWVVGSAAFALLLAIAAYSVSAESRRLARASNELSGARSGRAATQHSIDRKRERVEADAG